MASRTKIITLEDRFYTGEPTVQLVSTWGVGGKVLREKTSCHKTAAHSPALDYISSIDPEPGKSVVLIVGLGDHETYGPNRNGDGFPSQPIRGKIAADEVLPKHYKSYENAHVYEHHANSDPSKAIGRVKKAFWNPHMRRVEVLQDFEHSKAPHLLEKIASGEFPAVSMGCKIKYDVCSNCGNRAKTRGEYCDHLKYAMNRIDPNTGKQNAALNPSPVFFDSSWVVRPADRTGYMLKKVAREEPYELQSSFDLGELREDLCAKAAALGKAADIEKILQGEPAASVSSLDKGDARLVERYKDECGDSAAEPQDKRVVRIMISYKPSDALGTGDEMGLPMGMKELLRYFMGRLDPSSEKEPEEETVKSASRHVNLIHQIYNRYPRFYSDVLKMANLTQAPRYNEELAEKLAIYAPQSVTQDYFARRIIPEGLRGQERGLTDVVSWTDPNTGQQYSTNYGTVQKTHDALVEQGLKRKAMGAVPLLGGSALLGGATLGMGLSKRLRGLPRLATGLAALGLGAAGAHKALGPTEISGPKVQTDQGETVSGWTEMVPKRASAVAPEMQYIIKRASDGEAPLLPEDYTERFLSSLKTAEISDSISQFVGPTLDLDKVSQALGNSILKWIG